jgi:hypothetical protein
MLGCKQCLPILVVLAGCGEKKAAPKSDIADEVPPTFKTDRIECLVAPGEMGPGARMDAGRRGPAYCDFVLTNFLQANQQRHVVSVVPIEYPVAASNSTEVRSQGTQELLVTTSDRGSWPIASQLEVSTVPCTEERPGSPVRWDHRACLDRLVRHATGAGKAPALVVSLAGEGLDVETATTDPRPRTTQLLFIRHR